MRITNDWANRSRTVAFMGDVKGGGIKVETPSGLVLILPRTYNVLAGSSAQPLYDPVDREEIYYPGWASW